MDRIGISTLFSLFFSSHFVNMALIAGICASISSGIVGSYVVVKRIVFISGSISHSVLGGLGLAIYLKRIFDWEWLSPLYGAFFAAILSAWLIGWIRLYYRQREDTVIGALWAFGMSIGVIFISLTPGYNVELTNYLFGNILWVSPADILILLSLGAFLIVITFCFYRKFLAICFDEEHAELQALPVKFLYFLLLSLIAVTVVLLIQTVGAILVIAILSLPAAIANTFTKNLRSMMLFAALLGIVVATLGIGFSTALNWPPGATMALTATSLYILNLIRKKI